MTPDVLLTPRLRLASATAELLHAELDVERFGRLLGAVVPESWPPELYNEDARHYTLRELKRGPEQSGWWLWYVVLRQTGDGPDTLIGTCGYAGPPSDDGTVEVGYSVLPEYRRQGYATEAVAGLLRRAFADPRVARVIAETLPSLPPSIGVMEKSGFTFVGEGSETGVIRYALSRAAYADG